MVKSTLRYILTRPLHIIVAAENAADDIAEREKQTALYGGQAIIEGVMMKGPERTVAACRAPSGEIVHSVIREGTEEAKKNLWYKTPFLRGIFILIDAMGLGYKALMYSGEVADPDAKPKNPVMEYILMGVSIAIALSVFKYIPVLFANLILMLSGAAGDSTFTLAQLFKGGVPDGIVMSTPELLNYSIKYSLLEGLMKVIVLVGYMLIIRTALKEIFRVFQYHGAEHKTINAYEGGSDMSVDDIATYPTFHPRCGTSFLFAVILFSLVFAMTFPLITFWLFGDPSLAIMIKYRFVMHIIFLPVIASFGYEFIRFTAFLKKDSTFMKVLTYPGMLFQKITALEPEKEMLEVSVTSMRLAMGLPLVELEPATTEISGNGEKRALQPVQSTAT
ncbi:MAG TPA: DUF1385 domain-containing protein [bacterium]